MTEPKRMTATEILRREAERRRQPMTAEERAIQDSWLRPIVDRLDVVGSQWDETEVRPEDRHDA